MTPAQRIKEKQLALLKRLIDENWEPEIGKEWFESDLRRIGHAQLNYAPQGYRAGYEPETWCTYTGPNPVYDLETERLLKAGDMIGDVN